jgi:hypothetical protein
VAQQLQTSLRDRRAQRDGDPDGRADDSEVPEVARMDDLTLGARLLQLARRGF